VKEKILMCAVASFIATTANAQSSVTLFGAIDAGLTYVSNYNGHSNVYMQGGISNNTGFGLTATEDLGGGTSAVFKALNTFDIGSGSLYAPGQMFRFAYVGLQNDSYGHVSMGYQTDFMFNYMTIDRWGPMLASLEPTFTQGGPLPYAKLGLPDGSMDFLRTADFYTTPNSVSYESPSFNGLKFGVMYGFGGQPGAFSQGSTQSAGVSYNTGPIVLDAAYTYTKFMAPYDIYTNNGNNGVRNWAVGGRIAVGKGFLAAMIASAQNTFNNAHVMVYDFAATYPIAPATILGFEYQYNDGNKVVDNVKTNQVGLNLAYYLSKRTDVYAFVAYQHASGGAQANIPGSMAPTTGVVGYSSNGNQTMVRVGMMHTF